MKFLRLVYSLAPTYLKYCSDSLFTIKNKKYLSKDATNLEEQGLLTILWVPLFGNSVARTTDLHKLFDLHPGLHKIID